MASFMLMTRQWRHIKMVKRAGRAFDPGGISATAPGSLLFPAVPAPYLTSTCLLAGNMFRLHERMWYSNIALSLYISDLF
jgi:hypothetical protein